MRVAFGLALSVLGLQLITHATHAQNYPPAPPPPPLVSEPPPAAAASQPAPPPSYPTPQRFEPAAVERPERAPQPEPKRTAFNALYVELLGNAGVYSLNYERFVTDDVSIRGGLMYVSLGVRERGEREQAKATVLFVPLMVYYLGVGNADHKLDLGLGFLFIYATPRVSASAVRRRLAIATHRTMAAFTSRSASRRSLESAAFCLGPGSASARSSDARRGSRNWRNWRN
jgi:hypothetical protein